MTNSQHELLTYLATRKGVVPVLPEHRQDLHGLHDKGYVATCGDFARITDEGLTALGSTQTAEEIADVLVATGMG